MKKNSLIFINLRSNLFNYIILAPIYNDDNSVERNQQKIVKVYDNYSLFKDERIKYIKSRTVQELNKVSPDVSCVYCTNQASIFTDVVTLLYGFIINEDVRDDSLNRTLKCGDKVILKNSNNQYRELLFYCATFSLKKGSILTNKTFNLHFLTPSNSYGELSHSTMSLQEFINENLEATSALVKVHI